MGFPWELYQFRRLNGRPGSSLSLSQDTGEESLQSLAVSSLSSISRLFLPGRKTLERSLSSLLWLSSLSRIPRTFLSSCKTLDRSFSSLGRETKEGPNTVESPAQTCDPARCIFAKRQAVQSGTWREISLQVCASQITTDTTSKTYFLGDRLALAHHSITGASLCPSHYLALQSRQPPVKLLWLSRLARRTYKQYGRVTRGGPYYEMRRSGVRSSPGADIFWPFFVYKITSQRLLHKTTDPSAVFWARLHTRERQELAKKLKSATSIRRSSRQPGIFF